MKIYFADRSELKAIKVATGTGELLVGSTLGYFVRHYRTIAQY